MGAFPQFTDGRYVPFIGEYADNFRVITFSLIIHHRALYECTLCEHAYAYCVVFMTRF